MMYNSLKLIILSLHLLFKGRVKIQIVQSTNNQSFIEVFVNGELWKLIDKSLYKNYLRKIKGCSSIKELDALFKTIEEQIAKEYAYKLLSFRGYMKAELKKKLEKRKITHQTCLEVIDALEKKGYLNEKRDANLYIESSIRKGRGPLLVKKTLALKLENEELSDSLLSKKMTEEDQRAAIRKWIEKKYNMCDFADVKIQQKVYRFLRGKGFESSVICNILFAD